MPIPVSLITAIINALIEVASQPSGQSVPPYEMNVIARSLPEQAKQGVMLPPEGNGFITINGQVLPLAPTAQFRSEQNLIVMPFSIQKQSDVVFITDAQSAVYRVWILHPAEAAARSNP